MGVFLGRTYRAFGYSNFKQKPYKCIFHSSFIFSNIPTRTGLETYLLTCTIEKLNVE